MTGIGIDEVIARYVNGNNAATRTYLADALGSVIGLAKDDQAVTTQYGYSPYGETTQTGEAIKNDSQYTARENDNADLYYYRARYYDPVLKRFIAEDPIGLGGGINRWAYVGGDPLGNIDPDGLNPVAAARGGYLAGRALNAAMNSALVAATGLTLGGLIYEAINSSSSSSRTPNEGPPGGWVTNPGNGQERLYGPSGKPEVEIDWSHDHGAGKPHGHNWEDGRRGPGVPLSPWPPGRTPNSCPVPNK